MFDAVPSELLVVVDEGEGQVDVQRVGPVRRRRTLPGLEGDHQVDPGGRALHLELVHEVLAEDLAKQLLKLIVDADGAVRTTWDQGRKISWERWVNQTRTEVIYTADVID